LNNRISTDRSRREEWGRQQGAAAIERGFTRVTLRGNARGTVRVVGMRIVKTCGPPLTGAYFAGYSQGGDSSLGMIFDLDQADPHPQPMALTSAEGAHPLGGDFFDQKTISLTPGEDVTLTIGAFTVRRSCRFTLLMTLATPNGAQTEPITYYGTSFAVTAKAAPTRPGRPYSGYRTALIDKGRFAQQGWQPVDPAKFKE
jgi:hypothetical protein